LGTLQGGAIKRETFEDNFAFITQQFRLGQSFRVGRFNLTTESSENDTAGAEGQE